MERVKKAVEYVIPMDVIVTVLAIVAYCVMLYFDLGFYIATPIFLVGLMTYLAKGKFLKNLLWTALVMLFAFVVFRLVFGVIFP